MYPTKKPKGKDAYLKYLEYFNPAFITKLIINNYPNINLKTFEELFCMILSISFASGKQTKPSAEINNDHYTMRSGTQLCDTPATARLRGWFHTLLAGSAKLCAVYCNKDLNVEFHYYWDYFVYLTG